MLSSPYWKFKNWPIIIKLSVVFSIMLSMVIVWVVINSLTIYNRSSEDQIKQFIPEVLVQVSYQLDLYVEGLINDSQAILTSNNYKNLFKLIATSEYESHGKLDLRGTIDLHNILGDIGADSQNNLVNLIFYTTKGTTYLKTVHGGLWLNESYKERTWAEKVDEQNFAPIIVGFTNETFLGKGLDVFSIVQPIRNQNESELAGLLQVNGSVQVIASILDGLKLEADSFTYIVDQNNKIVYASNYDDHALNLSNWTNRNETEFADIVDHNRQKYLLSYTTSSLIGWKVVTMIPLKDLNKGMNQVLRMIWVWVLTGIVLVILLSTIVAFGITRALRLLTSEIKNFEDNQKQLGSFPARYDEVGRLALAYKRMTLRIRNLMDEIYMKETLRQEAVIQVLYQQMNPHFLYNALESIRMTLKMGNADKAEQGLVSLGHLLRYQTTSNSNLISVKQEIELIQDLLAIQKLRFADRLEVVWDIELEDYHYRIPCFLFQPLVENAIKYGESPYDQTIRIVIRLRMEGRYLVGSVIDEGNGMSEEKLEGVIENMLNEKKTTSGRSIGLFNIYQRIQLLYKGDGDFHIDSMEGLGTVATFKVPVISAKEDRGSL